MELTFEQVMEKYTPMVYRIAFTRLGSAADAEDVTQDVFLRYWKAGQTFESEEHRRNFLIRCAVNRANTYATSAWFRHRAHTDALENIPEEEPALDETPEETVSRKERRSAVVDAVLKLPPKYRTVVHLFYFEDMSIAQICEITGAKESTVKSQLSRARDKLKEILSNIDDWD